MHLVDDYRPGSGFFFGTSARSLLATGSAVVLPGRGGLAPKRADTVLRALGPDQILVGAVPFADDAPARLIVPEEHRWGPPLPPKAASRDVTPVATRHEPEPARYRLAVEKALHDIDDSELSKVVLARSVRITPPTRPDIPSLLRRLRHRQEAGFVFACELPDGVSLVGGSPELLVSRERDVVTAFPLAGSRPRTGDPEVDAVSRAELLASEKDRREHAHVVDTIARVLTPYCVKLSAPSTPDIVATAHMLHLGTRITGRLADPLPSALELASALHPTPAVCGTPTATAASAIARLEEFDRGFYSGMVGWCDSAGNGEWAVTIRCAEIADDSVRLFAGAGIVAGSDPDAELAETEAKLATMLAALGHRQEAVAR
ncbi:isochorismate synthase [Stackebrandtia soli]|uniref:isochorismate synthase n=1 Tax=Stackebrandtia soli TaxID=1892856 RepID=UPI0039EB89A4